MPISQHTFVWWHSCQNHIGLGQSLISTVTYFSGSLASLNQWSVHTRCKATSSVVSTWVGDFWGVEVWVELHTRRQTTLSVISTWVGAHLGCWTKVGSKSYVSDGVKGKVPPRTSVGRIIIREVSKALTRPWMIF